MQNELSTKEATERKKLRVLKASHGVFTTVTDATLFVLGLMRDAARRGTNVQRVFPRDLARLIASTFDGLEELEILHTLRNARGRDLIDKNYRIRTAGLERIASVLPQHKALKRWDNRWYVVMFDIPRRAPATRYILLRELKRRHFKPIFESAWVHPNSEASSAVHAFASQRGFDRFLMSMKVETLGVEAPRVLAERLWNLKPINRRYSEYLERSQEVLESRASLEALLKNQLIFLGILKIDPQLPRDLAPYYWLGEEAARFSRTILKHFKHELFQRQMPDMILPVQRPS